MRAVDTNILVRLLMKDDAAQLARVLAMLRDSPVSVTPTVILETEWVLRRTYRLKAAEIVHGLRSLLGLSELQVESAETIALALTWTEQGVDFADALHLASAAECDGFATFDRDFIRTAARLGIANVAEP